MAEVAVLVVFVSLRAVWTQPEELVMAEFSTRPPRCISVRLLQAKLVEAFLQTTLGY